MIRASARPSPEVSVVVPVYNVEPYLPQCLDSLLAQTFDDYEVVVVNDGSTDGSRVIIDRYVAEHPGRVRALDKPNGGLADARNYGIDNSSGKYLAFVDGDDEVEPDMLSAMHARARATEADMVMCGIVSFANGGPSEQVYPYYPEPDIGVFGSDLAHEPRLLFRVDASACNKLYARDLFDRTGIRFPVGVAFEDLPTVYRLLAVARRVEKIDRPLYRYRQRRAASITYEAGERFMDLVKGFGLIDDFYQRHGLFTSNSQALLRLHLTHLIAGRYPDFFLRARSPARRRFIEASFGLLDAEFTGWRAYPATRDLWSNPVLRAISTHRYLLDAFCRLPERAYLGLLPYLGGFDPKR
jgi:CDP-glycerol glycerophosphotransferase